MKWAVVGDSHQVRTVITLGRLMVNDLLLLAKYSFMENSQVVASKERCGQLPETLKEFGQSMIFFQPCQVFKNIMSQ